MSTSDWLLMLESCGTSILRFIFWDTLTGCFNVQTAASQTIGFAVQLGFGSGAGGLQQSMTVIVRRLSGEPQCTTVVLPAGMPHCALSNEYVFGGKSNVTFVMSELMRPHPSAPTSSKLATRVTERERMTVSLSFICSPGAATRPPPTDRASARRRRRSLERRDPGFRHRRWRRERRRG